MVFQGETALALVKLMEGNFLSVRLSTKSSDDFDNLKTGKNTTLYEPKRCNYYSTLIIRNKNIMNENF